MAFETLICTNCQHLWTTVLGGRCPDCNGVVVSTGVGAKWYTLSDVQKTVLAAIAKRYGLANVLTAGLKTGRLTTHITLEVFVEKKGFYRILQLWEVRRDDWDSMALQRRAVDAYFEASSNE